jgi:hypothetical protein
MSADWGEAAVDVALRSCELMTHLEHQGPLFVAMQGVNDARVEHAHETLEA